MNFNGDGHNQSGCSLIQDQISCHTLLTAEDNSTKNLNQPLPPNVQSINSSSAYTSSTKHLPPSGVARTPFVVKTPKSAKKLGLCSSSSDMSSRNNRRSQRLGGSSLPDFKALSLRGREQHGSDVPADQDATSKNVEFHRRQSFPSYDELMRFVKQYETQHSVRLNASMVTPQERLESMTDGQYYRYVIFWCNFDPRNRQMSAYTPIDSRCCPFFVRAAGCEKENCLIVDELSSKHIHSNKTSVLGPPPLPSFVDRVDAKQKSSLNRVRSKYIKRQKMGRVTKPSMRNRNRNKNLSRHRSKSKAKAKPSSQRSDKQGSVNSDHLEVGVVSVNECNVKKKDKETRPPKRRDSHDPGTSSNSRHLAANTTTDTSNIVCGLCDKECSSTDEFVGHVWLMHQILTETMVF